LSLDEHKVLGSLGLYWLSKPSSATDQVAIKAFKGFGETGSSPLIKTTLQALMITTPSLHIPVSGLAKTFVSVNESFATAPMGILEGVGMGKGVGTTKGAMVR
jgi:hypothetical protein